MLIPGVKFTTTDNCFYNVIKETTKSCYFEIYSDFRQCDHTRKSVQYSARVGFPDSSTTSVLATSGSLLTSLCLHFLSYKMGREITVLSW